MAVALTSGAMLMERNEGILERSLVNGINGTEILFSLVITQFVVMIFQTLMVLLVGYVIFDLVQEGNWFLAFAIAILSGTCGMCFGKYTLYWMIQLNLILCLCCYYWKWARMLQIKKL